MLLTSHLKLCPVSESPCYNGREAWIYLHLHHTHVTCHILRNQSTDEVITGNRGWLCVSVFVLILVKKKCAAQDHEEGGDQLENPTAERAATAVRAVAAALRRLFLQEV